MRLDDRLGHVQPQPNAPDAVLRHVRHPVEAAKELLLVFGLDTYSGVYDVEDHLVVTLIES